MVSRDWWEQQTCARKKRYPSYASAKDALGPARERAEAANDPKVHLLHVYPCPVKAGESTRYHLGHATGEDARRIEKRLEKRRRKTLWKAPAGG